MVGRTGLALLPEPSMPSILFMEHCGRNHVAILSAKPTKPLLAMVKLGSSRAYSLSLISYNSCTICRHCPKGRSFAKAALSAPSFFHLQRR
jgi:hypothetical protein